MRRFINIFVVLSLLCFSACDSEALFVEYQSVGTDLSWNVDDVKTFDFNIVRDGKYTVQILVSYITGYPWDKARVNFRMTGADFEKIKNSFEITIQESPGKYRGEVSLDYWLLKEPVLTSQELKAGKYSIVLKHDMPNAEFPYISEVGIRVIESK
jgi:gliding motility-associated lipoprotein GldH